MVAVADSIDDMAMLRHGGMGRIFARAYAPSTLGSFLRAFAFGHIRQLDAVAARFLVALAGLTPPALVQAVPATADADPGYALLDVDDTIVEVHGHAKQGAGFGYSRVRGLNALLATLATNASAPVIVAQRLRKGACNSARGAKRLSATRSNRLGGSSVPRHECWCGWTRRSTDAALGVSAVYAYLGVAALVLAGDGQGWGVPGGLAAIASSLAFALTTRDRARARTAS